MSCHVITENYQFLLVFECKIFIVSSLFIASYSHTFGQYQNFYMHQSGYFYSKYKGMQY